VLNPEVLQAWSASPTRFREDANAEEDLVLGGYADRLLVELAQNASDAALRSGSPGRLRLALDTSGDTPVLTAANTGAPLDEAGIHALTSLRASAKRDPSEGAAGRFGVGFAAVLAVSDAPEVRSRTGGVRFSAADTRRAVAGMDHVVAEMDRRDGRVPVLRLAWPEPAPPAAGYDTEVRLPLRDGAALGLVGEALAGFDAALLLGLPGLSAVEVSSRGRERLIERAEPDPDSVTITDGGDSTTWRVVRRTGEVPSELLADLPVEDRERTTWQVLWAVPVADDGTVRPLPGPQVVHAPTPSDEPLSVPARLIATFPLSPDRRRVPAGPLTDHLAARAAAALAALAHDLTPAVATLALVPRPGLARAALDASIATEALAALRRVPLLAPATGDDPLAGPDATLLARPLDDAVPALAEVLPGLLAAGYARADMAVLDALGVRTAGPAEVVDALAGLDRPPAWWRTVYAALEPGLTALAGTGGTEAFAALPVPLADGRTVTGPRGVLLPAEGLPADAVAALGLRVVDPDAAHPLLERLGARPASPAAVLADPHVAGFVAESVDEALDDPDGDVPERAEAVLAVVAAAGVRPGEEPWLAELALPGADGEPYPAGELLLPGGALAAVVEPDAPFGELDESDVDLADVGDLHLDDADGWVDAIRDRTGPGPVTLRRLRAVRDLEWVREDAWAGALALLGETELLDVLAAECVAVPMAPREPVPVPPYTTWWLSSRRVLDGHRPAALRQPSATELDGLYDPAPQADERLLAALGCPGSLDDVLATADGAADLLTRLADPARRVAPGILPLLYASLAAALDGVDVQAPAAIRVGPDRVADPDRVAVLDAPWLLDRRGDRALVLGGEHPDAVADLLDVPLLSEL
jgi:hypothetical protein